MFYICFVNYTLGSDNNLKTNRYENFSNNSLNHFKFNDLHFLL